MLALLVPGVGMGGGDGTTQPPPVVGDPIDFEYTRGSEIDFAYQRGEEVDTP